MMCAVGTASHGFSEDSAIGPSAHGFMSTAHVCIQVPVSWSSGSLNDETTGMIFVQCHSTVRLCELLAASQTRRRHPR